MAKTSKATTQTKPGSKTRTNAEPEPDSKTTETTKPENESDTEHTESEGTSESEETTEAAESVDQDTDLDTDADAEVEEAETDEEREERERKEAEAKAAAEKAEKERQVGFARQWVNRRMRDAMTVNVASRVSVGYLCRTYGLDGNEAQALVEEVLDPIVLDLDQAYRDDLGGELPEKQEARLNKVRGAKKGRRS
jgi:uncharacterized membrane protein YqiK